MNRPSFYFVAATHDGRWALRLWLSEVASLHIRDGWTCEHLEREALRLNRDHHERPCPEPHNLK